MKKVSAFLLVLLFSTILTANAQNHKPAVIAYFAGNAALADSFDLNKVTHVIFSFGHLKGQRLHISNAADTATIQKLVAWKSKNPSLKVMLSLGGWGGCKTCSDVFSLKQGRKEFANSVKELLDYFNADGIDLDWEYPAIPGPPGHPYKKDDKKNFTLLVKQLRKKLGKEKVISFAAGGFTTFLEQSINWKKTMKYCDFVNLMTYDLVHGYSTVTGHHTPLYSTAQQKESGNNAVSYLLSIGIPSQKLVLGAAFYGRLFENVPDINNGLYQPTRFKSFIATKFIPQQLKAEDGFVFYRDNIAKAPYGYNPKTKIFVTYEDAASLAIKTQYVIDKKLYGIMFWQLTDDKNSNGLLQAIDDVIKKN